MAKICPICSTSYPDSNAFCPNDGATLRAEESSQDLVGTVIADRYKINKLLGEGGMGRVYLAQHVRLPQQAAIKVLHPGMVQESGAVARFNREASNAARIEHDRVARVFDFGETSDGLVYLAMEFVPGQTLRSLLLEAGRLSPARAANIVYQVSEGLDAAHRIGIVHRDLKPDNILVVSDDNGDRCKVVDFGIAKTVDNSQTQLTQTGMLVGTPEFMSPEQVLGEQLDARSDVYALALVAYQAFAGTLPFGGTTPERSLAARLMEDPQPLSATAPDVEWPEALQQAFDRALQRDPAERTASAIEFGEAVVMAVESWLGVPVLRVRTPMSTPSIVVAASSITPSSLTPPTTQAAVPAAKTSAGQSMPAVAEPASRRGLSPLVMGLGGVGVIAASAMVFMMTRGDSPSANAAQNDSTPVVQTVAGADTTTPASQSNANSPPVRTASPDAPPPATQVASAPATDPASTSSPTTPAVPEQRNDAAITDSLYMLSDVLQATEDELPIRRIVSQITLLLPRARTPADSFIGRKSLFEAYMLLQDQLSACEHYRAAKRLADRLGPAQQQQVALFANMVTFAP